jgi:cytochrome bd-type quinol oxidase subunit 2
VVCSILGGVWSSLGDSNINTGYTIRRVGTTVFLIGVVATFAVAFLMRSTSVTLEQRNDKVLMQILFVVPIMFLRIIYATVQNFNSTPASPGHNTWVYLCLLLIPDFVSASIYTWFGAVVLKPLRGMTEQLTDYQLTAPGQTESGFQLKSSDHQEP